MNGVTLALKLASRFGWLVFPLSGKIPFKGTNGHLDASKDTDTIYELFKGREGANVGIKTGVESGIFVLDVDNKNDVDGSETLNLYEKEFGQIPTTLAVITPTGGYHYYFKHPGGELKNRSGWDTGLDIRGDGGYVVAPGSVIDNNTYEWELDNHPDDVSLSKSPEWLFMFIEDSPYSGEKFTIPDGIIPQGQRDETLFKSACALLARGLSRELAYATLKTLYGNCEQGTRDRITDKDLERIMNSAVNYHPEAHETITPERELGKPAKQEPEEKEYKSEDPGINEAFTVDCELPKNIPYSESWISKYMLKAYKYCIKYCTDIDTWLFWTGKYWEQDNTKQIQNYYNKFIERLYAKHMLDEEDKMKKFVMKYFEHGKMQAVIKYSQSRVSNTVKEFDDNAVILNLQNGVYDLEKQKLHPHSKRFLTTKICDVAYNGEAKCPNWIKFLDRVFDNDQEIIRFIQKSVGYSLTGKADHPAFYILYGTGANGKSTFLNTISHILGEYHKNTMPDTFLEKRNNDTDKPRNDIARLKGARFITTSEPSSNKYLDEGLVKTITGGDFVTARMLYKEAVDFKFSGKIWMATNYKIGIKGTDLGIWRRIKYIPFNVSIPKDERIPDYEKKYLHKELSGILNWAIEGYRLLTKEGYNEPDIVLKNIDEYRDSEDFIGRWLHENCFVDEEHCRSVNSFRYKVRGSVLYRYFHETSNNKYLSERIFYDYLDKKGFQKSKSTSGVYYVYGIKIMTDNEREMAHRQDEFGIDSEAPPF